MTDKIPSTDVNISADMVAAAISLLASFQQAGGSLGAVQGHSAQLSASDTQNKTDVNVPELMTGMNGLAHQMAVNLQAELNHIQVKDAQSAQFYSDLARNMALDHRDQNHTKQALAATFPFVVAGDAAEESANDTDK